MEVLLFNQHRKKRDTAVHLKLNAIAEAVRGKSVIMVDDSIVRGTTSGKIVRMLRKAGAKEVHMCISSPPIGYLVIMVLILLCVKN